MKNISITFRDGSYRPTASPILIQYFFDFLFLLLFFIFIFIFIFISDPATDYYQTAGYS